MMLVVFIMCGVAVVNAETLHLDKSTSFSEVQSQVQFLLEAREHDRLEIADLKQTNKNIHKELNKFEQTNEFLLEQRKSDRQEIMDLKQDFKMICNSTHFFDKRSVQSRQAFPGIGIGFTVCVGVGDIHNLGAHQTIVFDNVITNEHGAYHTSTGVFTAPSDGLYAFHLSAMSAAGQHMYLHIVKDGHVVDDMLTDGRGDQSWDSTSEMWVLKLNKGSEVWIRTSHAGEIHGNCHTMFSGFQLYETEI